MLRLRNSPDIGAGILMVVISVLFLVLSWDLKQGTLFDMGPGHFPRYVAGIAFVIGVILVAKGLRQEAGGLAPFALRPFIFVLGAVALFSFVIEVLGLAVTAAATVVLASVGSAQIKWKAVALTAVGMSALVCIIFIEVLGLPIPLWPQL